MVSLNRIRQEVEVSYKVSGADQAQRAADSVASAQNRLTQATERGGTVTETSARRQLSAASAYERMRLGLDENYRASQRYERGVATLDRAMQQGVINAIEYARTLDMLKGKYASAMGGANDNKLAPHQMQNLMFQAQDVVASLASGSSPLTVLLQQGGQVAGTFGPGTGVTGVLRGVGSALGELITPARAAGAGLAAAGILAYGSWSRFHEQQLAVTGTLQGLGRNVGLTTAQFMAMGEAAALSGNLSVTGATQTANALARTGRLNAENIERITALTKGLAATLTGGDLDQARDKLISTFTDPQRGILALNEQLRFMDVRTQRLVEDLFAAGRAQEAIRLAVDRMPSAMASYEQTTSATARAWQAIKDAASGADRAVGGFIDRATRVPSTQAQLEQVTRELERARQQASGSLQMVPTGGLLGQRVAVPRRILPRPAPEQISELEDHQRRLQAEAERQAQRLREDSLRTEARGRAQELDRIVRELPTGSEQWREFRQKQENLQAGLSDPNIVREAGNLRDLNAGLDMLTQARRSLTDANGDYLTSEERNRRAAELELQGLNERTTAGQARIAEERQRQQLAGQVITQAEARNRVEHAGNMVRAEAQRALQDELYGMDRQARLYGTVGTQREVATQLLERELSARQANRALTAAELGQLEIRIRRTAELQAVQGQLDAIYNQAIKPAEDYNRTLTAAGLLLDRGRISAEQYADAIDAARIKMLQSRGTAAGGAEAGLLRVAQEYENTSRAMEGFTTSSFNNVSSALTDMAMGTKSASDGFRDLTSTVLRSATDMAIRMAILGPMARSMSDAFGGGGLFGFLRGAAGASGAAGDFDVPSGGISTDASGFFHQYDRGGYTGHGGRFEPAGIVHRGEVVWSQDDVARYGGPHIVDAMRRGWPGYADGGYVGREPYNLAPMPALDRPTPVMPAASSMNVVINNHVGAQVSTTPEQGPNGPQLRIDIDRAVADAINKGTATNRALQNAAAYRRFGMRG